MTEEMEISSDVSPVDINGQLQSVFYQRTFNLGNYENEKIGVVVKSQEGQTYEQVLAAATTAVMKDHQDFDNLRERIAETGRRLWDMEAKTAEIKREIERLTTEKAKLEAAIQGMKVDHPEVVEAVEAATLKVGDRVAMVGTLVQIDPDDRFATYLVEWDNNSRLGSSWLNDGNLVRVTGIDAPETVEASDEEDDDDILEDEDFDDEDEDEDNE